MEKVTFMTDDGVTVVGEYQAGVSGGRAVLFLHMMPATKESWRPLAEALVARGFSTLAIDLRGHGESTVGPNGTVLDYESFSDEQHQAAMLDVEAAVRWMTEHGATSARLALVGASIGANLAIVYAARHGEIPATSALSPGLDYHGVTTDAVAMMPREQKLLLVASTEDEYAHSSCVTLAAKKGDTECHSLEGAGHGTRMLAHEPGFFAYLVEWISNNVR